MYWDGGRAVEGAAAFGSEVEVWASVRVVTTGSELTAGPPVIRLGIARPSRHSSAGRIRSRRPRSVESRSLREPNSFFRNRFMELSGYDLRRLLPLTRLSDGAGGNATRIRQKARPAKPLAASRCCVCA
jgi:hypothetical protein